LDPAALGMACALGSAVMWAVTSLLVRSLSPHFTSVGINALRSAVGGALLVGYVLLAGGMQPFLDVSPAAFTLMTLSVVAAFGVGDSLFFESTRTLGLGRAMTIATSYPVLAAVLAAVFLDEPLTLPVVAGTLMTLGGLVLIVMTKADATAQRRPWLGIGAAALASVGWAVSVVLMKAPLREVDATVAQAIRLPVAALVLWCTPWARGALGALWASRGHVLTRFTVLSALTAVSSVMFVASVKYAGVTVASVLSSTAPLFAIPLGVVFLGERLPPAAVLGAIITVAGIVVLRL
jgi:drug/metabolite transporter (DMT)-like permease